MLKGSLLCVCMAVELVDSNCSDLVRLSVPPEPVVWQLYRQSIVFFFVALVFRFRVRRNSAISNVYCYIWRHAVQFQAIVHTSANCAVFLFKAATGVNCTKSLFDSLKSLDFVQLCSTQMWPVLQSDLLRFCCKRMLLCALFCTYLVITHLLMWHACLVVVSLAFSNIWLFRRIDFKSSLTHCRGCKKFMRA